MNPTIHNTIESTLPKYLEFKIFEVFKNQFLKRIIPHCRENSKEDIYQHIFLCPATLSETRNFQLKGVLSPFVCLWRTSPIQWNKQFYGRSVLPRTFTYTDKDGKERAEMGYLYDVQFTMDLFSSSYYKSFRDRVNIDIIDMDRLRYFNINMKELLKDCTEFNSCVEFMLKGINQQDNIDLKGSNNRSFNMTCSYEIKATVPYCHSFDYVSGIALYLNDNLIYYKEADTISDSQNPQTNP